MKLSDCSVEHINSTRGREFVLDHHYSGSCHGGPMCWGMLDPSDRLVGVCAFATPISENVRRSIWADQHADLDDIPVELSSMNQSSAKIDEAMKDHTTELHRLVTLDECPHNTETWFISRAIDGLKDYKPKYKAVISFADTTEGHSGTIYQASNAIYYGMTGEHTFYRDGDGNLRAPRSNGENISVQEAKDRGWEPEKRKAKHRYLFLLPDPYESKDDIRAMLDVDEQSYPD